MKIVHVVGLKRLAFVRAFSSGGPMSRIMSSSDIICFVHVTKFLFSFSFFICGMAYNESGNNKFRILFFIIGFRLLTISSK